MKKYLKSLSKAEIYYIEKSLLNGISHVEIANKLGITSNTMNIWIKKLVESGAIKEVCADSQNQKIVKEFLKLKQINQIAENYGLSVSKVMTILRTSLGKTVYKKYKNMHDRKHRLILNANQVYKPNPNPPTETTDMLICNYFDEGIHKNHLPVDLVIKDISIELGRPKSYIKEVLKKEKAMICQNKKVCEV